MNFSLAPCPDCTRCDADRCDAPYCRLDHPSCPWCADEETAIRDALDNADNTDPHNWSAA